jgi:hypothetical protein
MMRKPNYRFERTERDRTKQAKKEEKTRRQQERASQQRTEVRPQPDGNLVDVAEAGSGSSIHLGMSPPA